MNVKLKIIRQTYQSTDYNIFTFFPIEPKLPMHPKWRSNSLKGNNISFISVDKIYTLDIEPIDEYCYQLVSMPQVDVSNLTHDESLSILKECTSEKLANELLEKYPNIISLIVSNKTDSIDVNNLKGIKKKLLTKISNNIKGKYSYCMIQQQFKEYKLTFSEAKTLSDKYGDIQSIKQHINQNPYSIMIDDLDRSFERVDKIILSLYPELKGSCIRCEYAVISLLKYNEISGNTYSTTNYLSKSLYEIDNDLLSKIKQVCIDSDKIYYNVDKNILAYMPTYLAEKNIAEFIKEKCAKINRWDFNYIKYKQIDNIELTNEQVSILKSVCENDISMLLGAGGVGKSASIKAIVNMLEDNNKSYLLLTPTGTSAKVLSKYTCRPASTIHKKLTSDGYISADVIIIDEFSFVGVDLMNTIVSNIDIHSKIVLVGDEYQLGSIACGNVLKDMIDSKIVPYIRLTKVFRYGKGAIDTVATDTRNGVKYLLNDVPIFQNETKDQSYKFIPMGTNPLKQILDSYKFLLTKYTSNDILILSPFNINCCGTIEINNLIQEQYNPLKKGDKELKYRYKKIDVKLRKGDRVLNIKNLYDAINYENYEPNAKVMNGEIGTIIKIEDDDIVVQFDDHKILYPLEYRKYLILAYAETIHKAQGNQSKAVIFISTPIHQNFLHRALIYVANSRAQEMLIQIGDSNIINQALGKIEVNERITQLKDFLIKQQ